jgi:hypothetical protein
MKMRILPLPLFTRFLMVEGNPGEQGFVDGQKTDGSKNLIKVVEDSGHTKFLGSSKWNVFHGQKFNEYKFSNHPAGSVLLDYREPVQNLKFNAGTTGKMHSGGGSGDNKVGGSRNLSFSIGNSFTSGGGFKPSGDIQKASASVPLEECEDASLTVEGNYECDQDFLTYTIQSNPQKSETNVLLNLIL